MLCYYSCSFQPNPQPTMQTPQAGFAGLDPPVCIKRLANTAHLPAAHTCARTLDLPAYSTEVVLKERVAMALAHLEDEFGFG